MSIVVNFVNFELHCTTNLIMRRKKFKPLTDCDLRDWAYVNLYVQDSVGKSTNLFLDRCSKPDNVKGVVLATHEVRCNE